MTKAEVEPIVESLLTKWTSTLQWKVLKAVESTFEDTLQVSYFNPSSGLKTAMFKVLQQVLREVIRSGCAPTVQG